MIPTIRPATLTDLPAINAIYNYYVANSTCTYATVPTSDDERLKWFTSRSARLPVIVAERDGEIIGWASLSTWNTRCGYLSTVESSVYIRHDCHRQGLGKMLMLAIIDRAKEIGHHTILAGISSDQSSSIALHEALGFEKISHFKQVGFKFNRWLDVIHMQLMLDSDDKPRLS